MCELCKQFICPSNCPNAPEPTPDSECKKCKRPLYKGDRVFRIDKEVVWCEFCVDDSIEIL